MIDRAIGIAGIAVSLVFAVLPYFLPSLPNWLMIVGVACGTLLLGIAWGIVVADRRQFKLKGPIDRALHRLRVYADTRLPEAVHYENIFRWYYCPRILSLHSHDGEPLVSMGITTLFVSFEPGVKISTLKVRSLEGKLPSHEIKDFNQRFAIIAFTGEAPEGILEVFVEP